MQPGPDLNAVRAFLGVMQAGSVSAGAAALHQPRSRVRRALNALNDEVGVELYWSTVQGVHPTPAGRLLIERGPALLERYAALLGDARRPPSDSTR